MSTPHTGTLRVEIDGLTYSFDGDRWAGGDDASRLNEITDESPKHHYSIDELATRVLTLAGFEGRYRIVHVQADKWTDDLDDDAID